MGENIDKILFEEQLNRLRGDEAIRKKRTRAVRWVKAQLALELRREAPARFSLSKDSGSGSGAERSRGSARRQRSC